MKSIGSLSNVWIDVNSGERRNVKKQLARAGFALRERNDSKQFNPAFYATLERSLFIFTY